jgi:signal transduction histidine kinase/ActR/RegA family two-component response regulator
MSPRSASLIGFGTTNAASAVASVVLLAVVLWVAHLSLREVQVTSDLSDHTQEVRVALDAVSESLLKMETGQRGYLLTGEQSYLEPYDAGASALDAQLKHLEDLISDDAEQTRRFQRLQQLVAQRQEQIKQGLTLRQTVGIDAAINHLKTGRPVATMKEILDSLATMSAEETSLLDARRAQERASLERNFYVIVVFVAIAAALLFLMLLRVQREMRARAEAVRQLDAANATLAESTASKTRFLSAASHDLRQPLHSLSLLNAALSGQNLSAPAQAIVAAQKDSLEAMSALVNRLLNISMIESGVIQPYFEDMPLASLLASLEAEFLPQARLKKLQLAVEPSNDAVRTDPTLLREIVQNLVANAIRYTDRGRISIRARRQGDAVLLEVADTGRGIPEEQLERIFEEFYQVRHGDQKTGKGFGLGLSIVSRLTKLLDIPIRVSSRPGEGTTFTLKLPAALRNLQPAQSPLPTAPSIVLPAAVRGGLILLVDDEAAVRNATALFLTMDGHEVKVAGSPEEALDIAKQCADSLDVIVSDYQLNASLNGADLIEKLRELQQREIPAVVLSGDTMKVTPRCASISSCRVFHKPVDAEELSAHIRQVLEGAIETALT